MSSASSSAASSCKSDKAMPLSERMVIAALAGMGAATVCHPLDVVRVQMQIEGAYKNSLDATVKIYKRSGLINGLYAGISAAYLRQWLYGSCRIGIYSYLLENAKIKNKKHKHDVSFVSKLSMGMMSGGIGSLVGTPSELALVRMSADSKLPVQERRNYRNVIDCVVRITKEEGLLNLWRGAAPTVLRAILISSCQMGVTSEIKDMLIKSGRFGENGQWCYGLPMMFCATLCSSFVGIIVANPLDVIKSRMQNTTINADGTALYSSMADCLSKSLKSDGVFVLWRGFTPAFIKFAPSSLIGLTLADKLTKAITGKDAL